MFDVVIIGAGVVGGMIARTLSAYDLKICIVEKENDVAMGATKANSAIVHAGFDAKVGSLKARLNVRGAELYPVITKELGVKYQNNGSLVIGFTQEDRETIQTLYERGCKNGVKNLKIVEKEELKVLEPNLSEEVLCALYAPTAGITCPYELAIAAIGNAMDNSFQDKLVPILNDLSSKLENPAQALTDSLMIEFRNICNDFRENLTKGVNDQMNELIERFIDASNAINNIPETLDTVNKELTECTGKAVESYKAMSESLDNHIEKFDTLSDTFTFSIALPERSSVIETSNTLAIGSRSEISGYPLPVSHLEIVLSETPSFSATSS
jgi:hypothetical protein